MTPAAALPRLAFDDPALARRAFAAGLTGLVHLLFFAIIVTIPLYQLPDRGTGETGGGGRTIGVYTVSGGREAQSDAPLNEPLLADRAAAEGEGEGSGTGEGEGEASAPAEAEAQEPLETEQPVEAEDIPEPVEAEPATELAEPTEAATEAQATLLAAPGSGNRPLETTEQAARPATRAAPPPAAPADPDAPIATTQEAPGSGRVVIDAPTFADILARADTGLNVEDFRVAELAAGTDGAVRESLCLSSSQANLDAADCPEGPNPNQSALAAYGLSEPGEAPPQFAIDMDRLAFQLAQMGANPSVIERILLGTSEARRRTIETPALERQMGRDAAAGARDNLGVGNPFGNDGIPMPDDPDG